MTNENEALEQALIGALKALGVWQRSWKSSRAEACMSAFGYSNRYLATDPNLRKCIEEGYVKRPDLGVPDPVPIILKPEPLSITAKSTEFEQTQLSG